MSRVPLGMLLGLVIGAVDVLLMLPLSFPDRRASFAGAFGTVEHVVRDADAVGVLMSRLDDNAATTQCELVAGRGR